MSTARKLFRPMAMFCLMASASVFCPGMLAAADFPSGPVKLVVGFRAGSTTSSLGDILAQKLREIWQTPVVVEYRPGADGMIAAAAVANGQHDGQTLLLGTNALCIVPQLRNLSFDTIRDLEPLTILARDYHYLLVPNNHPTRTLRQFIDLAKAQPGTLSYASAGPLSAAFLRTEQFKQLVGIEMVHIAYPGAAPAMVDLAAGRVHAIFTSQSAAAPLLRAGKIRMLAVASPRRDPALPEIPTVAEVGAPGFYSDVWFGLLAPAKTPPSVLARLRTDVARAMKASDTRDRIAGIGSNPLGNTPEEFREVIRNDLRTFGELIQRLGLDKK